jgi:lysophospholipase L1-like esterase
MSRVIKHIKKSFPNASIVLISIGDKSYKNNNEYITEQCVPAMVAAQKRIAKKNKIAFWSLYEAMGGEGSMVNWVTGDTVYAGKDYTHLNFKGAKKVGGMLFDNLISSYRNYYKQQSRIIQN